MADVHARRRRNGLAVVAGVSLLVGIAIGAGGGSDVAKKPVAKPIELPGGGRTIFPGRRIVTYYGLPGDDNLGVLGIGKPDDAGKKLIRQARKYKTPGRKILPAMELIGTLATAAPGVRGEYNSRTSRKVIHRYLKAARKIGAILILDIQPGRGEFGPEIDYLSRYLEEPDVGLALDPEWKVGPTEIPGQVIGSMPASDVNAASAYLSSVVRKRKLPQKLLLVHQFTPGGIKDPSTLKRNKGVALAVNIDGFGTRAQKTSKYRQVTTLTPNKTHGFKLFFEEDQRNGGVLMTPPQVLRLRPQPQVVVYE